MSHPPDTRRYPRFDRRFFGSPEDFTVIGEGELGGKALGLAAARDVLAAACPAGSRPGVDARIPRLTVLSTEVFEQFLERNDLQEIISADLPDERIAHAFLQGELPPTFVGDLRALIADVHTPLAIRSSSLLEDALQHPFAGVYATKMIPNNEPVVSDRFRRLT